jgi:phosphoglycerate dehydrogenase-like enzyme/2-keto-3-deoxy-L-rhamnonate aldolase RhmA
MKTAALQKLRRTLAADEPVYGLWITLESPSITEMAVALGLDWVVIDAEHGHLDWKEIVEHIRATVRSDTVALVRVAELNLGLIKRALDIGADGVVVPWVESVDQLRQAVAFAHYPPDGVRGIGAERATAWGQCIAQHTADANQHVLVVPIIETVRSAPHVPQMCQVDGVELFFLGPADYSSTAGYPGQWEGSSVAQQLLAIKDTVRQAGKHCGVLATSNANLLQRRAQGFTVLGLGQDGGLLLRSLHEALATVNRDRKIVPSLRPESEAIPLRLCRADRSLPMNTKAKTFRVALTGDFYSADGTPRYPDLGLSIFGPHEHIECVRFQEHRPQIGPDQIGDAQGVIVLTPAVTAESVSSSPNLLAVGRFGVGYDAVNVQGCTRADVVVLITPGAVDRSVAEATIGWMIALTHHLRAKDLLVRTGNWDERSRYMGRELRDRTFGAIGLGGIGRKVVQLLQGFGMNQPVAFDPYADAQAATQLGVRLVPLDELLATADFVSIHCPLTEQTHNLIGPREFARMKPEGYLINTARGGIVNEDALFQVLKQRRIAGAALDCFAEEPVTRPHRFGELDNVLLAPHCIAWTAELFRDIGRAVCQGMLDLSLGKRPRGVVNPQVFERESFRQKWARLRVENSAD